MREITDFEKNLVDLNNSNIPEEVMKKFWEIKEELGTQPLGVSKLDERYYIICPVLKKYILWKSNNA